MHSLERVSADLVDVENCDIVNGHKDCQITLAKYLINLILSPSAAPSFVAPAGD